MRKNKSKQKRLLQYKKNELPAHLQCKMKSCNFRQFHQTGQHRCRICSGNHNDCSISDEEELQSPGGPAGVAASDLINSHLAIIKYLHSIGQAANPDAIEWAASPDAIEWACKSPQELEDSDSEMHDVKCPLCGAINKTKPIEIFVDAQCIVCTEQNVQIMLHCKHACLCLTCYDKLNHGK